MEALGDNRTAWDDVSGTGLNCCIPVDGAASVDVTRTAKLRGIVLCKIAFCFVDTTFDTVDTAVRDWDPADEEATPEPVSMLLFIL